MLIHAALVVGVVAVTYRLLVHAPIHRFLAWGLTLAIGLWYVIPGVLVLVFQYERIAFGSTIVDRDGFLAAYAGEAIALIAIIAAVLVITGNSRYPHSPDTRYFSQRLDGVPLLVLVFFFVAVVIRWQFGTVAYLDANSAALYETRGSSSILIVGRQFLAAGVMLLAIGTRERGPVFYSAMVLLGVDSVLSLISGSRIPIITLMVILLMKFADRRLATPRNLAIGFLALVFIVQVAFPIAYSVGRLRQAGIVEDLPSFQDGIALGMEDYASIAFTKFDSFSAGSRLLSDVGPPGDAGLAPYVGAAFVFVPRFVWPDRPVASSIDGTVSGTPWRLLPQELGARTDSANFGISPLHISLWHFGLLGAPVFVATVVGFLLVVDWLLKREALLVVVGLFVMSIPSFHTLIASPDVLLRQCATVFPLVVAWGIVRRAQLRANVRRPIRGASAPA